MLLRKAVSGTTAATIADRRPDKEPLSWSPSGVTVKPKGQPFRLGYALSASGEISPDGRWVRSWQTSQTRREVVRRAVSGPGRKWLVTHGARSTRATTRNEVARELVFISQADKLMSWRITLHADRVDAWARCAHCSITPWGRSSRTTDAPDGQHSRHRANVAGHAAPLTLIANWPALLAQ